MELALRPSDKKAIRLRLLLSSLLLCGLLIFSLFQFKQLDGIINGPLCLFRRLTGKPCLFCGLSRSLLNSFRLNLRDAFLFHFAGVFVFFAVIALAINTYVEAFTGKKVHIVLSGKGRRIIAFCAVILLLSQWLYKLIKGGPYL